jgi:hypothetical protein
MFSKKCNNNEKISKNNNYNDNLGDNVLPSSTATVIQWQIAKLVASHDIASSFNLRCPQKHSGFKNFHIDAGKFSNLYSRFTGLVLQTTLPQPAVNCHAAFQAFSTQLQDMNCYKH